MKSVLHSIAALVVVAMMTATSSAQTITVRDSWTPSALQAGWWYGMGKGLFEEQGIDIVHEDGDGSTTTVSLLAAKQFDIGWGDLSTMAVGRGRDMKVVSVMGLLRKTQLGVFVPAGSGLNTPKDLEGETVLFTARSVEGPYLESFFAAGGADISKVDLVNVDATAKISAYNAGEGMAVVTTIPFGAPIINPHRESDTIEFADYGFVLPGYGMYVHEDTLEEKKEAIGKVVDVMIRSWIAIMEEGGAEEAADIMIRMRPDARLIREQLVEQIKLHIPYFYTDATRDMPLGWQAESDWAQTIQNLETAGLVPAGSKPSDYFTNEFIGQ